MEQARTFQEWEAIASRLDTVLGNDIWRQNPASKHYDYKLIAGRFKRLIQARKEGDVKELVSLLRSGLLRNLGSIGSISLYNRAYAGTKLLIEDYVNEVISGLLYIDETPAEKLRMSEQQRLDFFHDTRQSFGRSALVLHGGSLLGLCHIGTVKALHENGLLPQILSGATVGAMVAALACSVPDEELISTIDKISSEMPSLSKEYSSFGSVVEGVISSLYPPEILLFEQYVRGRLGNMTFEEAYLLSERVLNITVTPKSGPRGVQRALELPRLMNYLTTPNVVVWTAIRASIGTGILPGKVEILAKNNKGDIVPYLRENVEYVPSNTTVYLSPRDSPYTRLSELFNVNSFIVSLTRPYFAPLLLSDFKHRGHHNWVMQLLKLIRLELQHRLAQLTQLGLLPGLIQRIFVDEDIPGGFQVTIVPEPPFLRDFGKVFDSHNIKEKVDYWIHVGERGVWPMMAIIWARSAVEIALDSIYRKIPSYS